ncbi:alpha-D-ribose 1-methylphosphonate 5-triphosphate diphosphatase [Ascidiaceihabitans sp.]|uniref:alpha-D-ribose 1-methylphosphonate 5-triphosphate diphosphatase n=1 Tax=Ascidiaceihabitans sp. TaxID=1872644 RepID=UPI003299F7F5
MTTTQTDIVFANARLILPTDVIVGGLRVQNGQIVDIHQGAHVPPFAIDCGERFLAPGLIELHTDNLERHMQPRPKVNWPHKAAILGHDREMAGCGITTVFDAIRVGSIVSDSGKKRYGRYARSMADDLLAMRDNDILWISHHIHLRAELCSETLAEELEEFGPDDHIGIVSLMDHTPGQRQFRDLKKFEDYVCGKNGLSRDNFGDYIDFLYGLQAKLGTKHEDAAIAAAARYGATLASHDDTTADQVAHSHANGVTLAEFPTSIEAAKASKDAQMATIMGAPNLVRGGSHSGNVAALELAELGHLDILSSDYIPAALLQGALQLAELWGDMAAGLATVTANPAKGCGLSDRGSLALNTRADLVMFEVYDGLPLIHGVWCRGLRVA